MLFFVRFKDPGASGKSIIGKGHDFKTIKLPRLMSKIFQIWCGPDGLVLYPFPGPGTTIQALLASGSARENNPAGRRATSEAANR